MGGMSKKKNTQRKRQVAQQQKPFAFKEDYDVVIVGAGASGLACAVACLEKAQGQHGETPRILIVDQGKRIGSSILRSGNGRCNFSNAQLQVERYRNGAFVSRALGALGDAGASPITSWFEHLGLVWSEAPGSNGLLYPFSNKAASVLEVLTAALPANAVDLHTCVRALAVRRAGSGFEVQLEEALSSAPRGGAAAQGGFAGDAPGKPKRATVKAACVVVATGGASGNLISGMQDELLAPWAPTLGPLAAEFPEGVSGEALDGIRCQAGISLADGSFSEEGEVLFRSYGISGIVVFNASRYAEAGSMMIVDFLPAKSPDETLEMMRSRVSCHEGQPAQTLFQGFMLPELGGAVLSAAGIGSSETVRQDMAEPIARALKRFPLKVRGIADEKQCQVHRGGVKPCAVRAETLELKGQPGLYVLGEALDVDGPCGGYNLHWAWACGILAGNDIAQNLMKGQPC